MNTPAAAAPSNFVTVLAWMMIAFGAFGVLASILQNVMVNLLFPTFQAAMSRGGEMPAFPLAFFRVIMLLGLAFSVFMTYAAYALLKRRNWARLLYIVLFVVSAVMYVVMAALFGLGFGLVGFPLAGPEFVPASVQSAMSVIAITFALFMVALAVLHVWLAQRLRSPAIAAEFAEPGLLPPA